MRDLENNDITLTETPNKHTFVWGQSGQGKTYYMCRKLEESIQAGSKALVLDYSGSYSASELSKNDVTQPENISIWDVSAEQRIWRLAYINEENFISILADSLIAALEIRSFHQKRWIKAALSHCVKMYHSFSTPLLFKSVENIKAVQGDFDASHDKDAVSHLLTRLMPYQNLGNFQVFFDEHKTVKDAEKPVTILQVSDFSNSERRFLSEMMLHLLWAETRMRKCKAGFTDLFLDEIQYLSLKEDSPLSSMLREGRKYGLGITAATQFLSSYDKDEVETLMQAGHFMVFRPSYRDIAFTAKTLFPDNSLKWKRILGQLQVGEAVLVGSYRINGGSRTANQAIICKI